MKYADLIDILGRTLGTELAERANVAIRAEASGECVYIPRRETAPVISPTDTARSVQARYGVPPRTARDWVRRWR